MVGLSKREIRKRIIPITSPPSIKGKKLCSEVKRLVFSVSVLVLVVAVTGEDTGTAAVFGSSKIDVVDAEGVAKVDRALLVGFGDSVALLVADVRVSFNLKVLDSVPLVIFRSVSDRVKLWVGVHSQDPFLSTLTVSFLSLISTDISVPAAAVPLKVGFSSVTVTKIILGKTVVLPIFCRSRELSAETLMIVRNKKTKVKKKTRKKFR